MAEYEMLKCDQCGNRARRDRALNWLEIQVAGVDARTIDDVPVEGHYCSKECAIGRLSGVRKPARVPYFRIQEDE